jgi:hypothetical protein
MLKIYGDHELIPVPCSIGVCPLCGGGLSIRVENHVSIFPGVNLHAPSSDDEFDLYCENQNRHPEIPISVILWKAIVTWLKQEPFFIELGDAGKTLGARN